MSINQIGGKYFSAIAASSNRDVLQHNVGMNEIKLPGNSTQIVIRLYKGYIFNPLCSTVRLRLIQH